MEAVVNYQQRVAKSSARGICQFFQAVRLKECLQYLIRHGMSPFVLSAQFDMIELYHRNIVQTRPWSIIESSKGTRPKGLRPPGICPRKEKWFGSSPDSVNQNSPNREQFRKTILNRRYLSCLSLNLTPARTTAYITIPSRPWTNLKGTSSIHRP